jgi:trk system potassium uptake protein TrkA
MAKQVLVIGLGNFGMALAQQLTQRGVEVLAADHDPELVQEAASFAAQAVTFDATDEDDLARAEPASRDFCVCAIGMDARDASIVCTALLRQLGAKKVIARSTDPLHGRILKLVGAHEVVNPEQAFGERLAARMAFPSVLEQVPLGPDLVLTEVAIPRPFIGRSLSELNLPRRHSINVVAIRRARSTNDEGLLLPEPTHPLQDGDILVVVGRPGATNKLLSLVS